MSTYTRKAEPLDLVIGRLFTLPLTHENGTAGLAIDAALTWPGLVSPVVPTVADRDDTVGTATLTITAAATLAVPAGLLSELRVTYTDSAGETDDLLYRVNGVRVLSAAAVALEGGSPAPSTSVATSPVPSATEQSYAIAITAHGQTLLPLSRPPTALSTLVLTVNGIDYRAPLALTTTELAITWAGGFALDPTDDVHVTYF